MERRGVEGRGGGEGGGKGRGGGERREGDIWRSSCTGTYCTVHIMHNRV